MLYFTSPPIRIRMQLARLKNNKYHFIVTVTLARSLSQKTLTQKVSLDWQKEIKKENILLLNLKCAK